MNKLDINILRPSKPDDKKTAALPSRKVRKLGRRRHRPKYLNVYDFAQYDDGGEIDYFNEEVSYTFFEFAGGPLVAIPTGGLTSTYNDIIFADDHTDWPDIYKNITADLEDYHIHINGLLGYVADKGLLITDDITELEVVEDDAPGTQTADDEFFPEWPFIGHSVKYTALPDFSEPSVPFTLDKSCDLFLTPMFMSRQAQAVEPADPPFYPKTGYVLNQSFTHVSRADKVNNSTWDHIWENRRSLAGNLTAGDRSFLRNMVFAHPDQQMYTLDIVTNGLQSGSLSGAAGFPTTSSGTYRENPNLTLANSSFGSGTLIGAIRKHLTSSTYEWYFLWADGDWNFNADQRFFTQISI